MRTPCVTQIPALIGDGPIDQSAPENLCKIRRYAGSFRFPADIGDDAFDPFGNCGGEIVTRLHGDHPVQTSYSFGK